MSRLTSEITLADVDEWFKIGKKTAPKDVKTVPRSATGGRFFDLKTQRPIEVKVESELQIPPYQRNPYDRSKRDYALRYQREEERELMANAYSMNDDNLTPRHEHADLDSIATTTVAMPEDVMPANATDIYRNYNFTHEYEKSLPITAHKEQVIATIESNQVTVVQGSTGSGKTTQVPQYILDHYAKLGKYCNIIVTQPRRIAAMSIARRVCSERGWQLGSLCGYQVGLDKQASNDTRILYVTTGVLLRKLVKAKNMVNITHVLLDEVHERDQNTDFSLLIVRKLLRTNSRHVKVVLMSATFDSDLFAQYFSLPIRGQLEPAPVVSVEGKAYSVSEFYADDLTPIGEIPPLKENDPEISIEAFIMATRLIEEFDTFEIKTQGRSETGFAKFRGTVLVFLPGFSDIQTMEERLRVIQVKHNLKIIPLHSTITVEEQILVFEVPKDGERKVILSTNIAESSITVPDIKYVIDFCLTKNLISDPETNYTTLQVEWASKANCIQRKGRAGRVSNGRVYRMITRHFWDNYIQNYGIPEMQRCPLDHLILQTKIFDMGEPKAMLALALSPPNLDDIEKTILLLKEVGALSTLTSNAFPDGSENRHDGELTFVGRVLADLPVDIKIGKMLMFGHVFGFLEECLIIAAAMSLKSIFSNPFRNRLQAYRHKLDWARGTLSDSLAILNAYKEYEWRKNMGEFRRGQSERDWCHRHFLQPKRLRQVGELIKELADRLGEFNIVRPRQRPNYVNKFSEDQERLLLKLVLCGAFYPNYFLSGEVQEETSIREMSGHDPHHTVMVKGLPANQGSLYKQALEDQFREIGPNPTAHFEETRAYIQFQWRHEHQGKVHPGVYLALKTRLMNMPLQIELYPTDVAHAMMQKINQQKEVDNSRLRTNRLTASNETKLQAPMPEPSKTFVVLVVTHIEECAHFWAQYQEEQNYNDLQLVQSTLNQGNLLQPVERASIGMYVAAPFRDEGSIQYYRARVDSLERKEMRNGGFRDIIEVFFVDYGNTEKVRKEDLRKIPQHLLQVPLQAVECVLSEVRPSAVKCPDGRWTKEATERFGMMTLGKSLFAQVFSTVRNTLRVELIQSVGNGRQISINKELINTEFADPAEECFLSKQDHEFRKSEAIVRSNRVAKQEEGPKNDWLSVALSSSVSLSSSSRTNKKRGTKETLRGPYSPYEMSFFSATSNGRLMKARIEQDSVNSISIDDEPQFPYSRMMVAGFVGLNPSGSVMIARDTTIMPSIPGLPALVALLFAPMVEFRTDKNRKRYTGAICGLGVDKLTNQSAFPDHDMEVSLDTEIDLEDILKINGVRMAINMALGSENSVSSWGEDAVFKIQENARRKMMEIMQKRRDAIESYNFERPYRWNQVDPNEILHHNLDGTPADNPVLLNLHNGIALVDDKNYNLEEEEDNELIQKRKHAEWLRRAAKDFSKRDPIVCKLCNLTWQTPQLLSLHLETKSHKDREEKLYT